MRNLYDREVARFRLKTDRIVQLFGSVGDDTAGAFEARSPRSGEKLFIVASTGEGWDHVSVSCQKRCPTWEEMSYVKRLFFLPGEVAYQLHVGEADHINFHENCLHLWRCLDAEVPLPPPGLIAPIRNDQRKAFYEKYPDPGPAKTV